MSDTNLDIEAEVTAATSEEEFDALEYFSNASLPTGSVTLYRDTAAAVELNELLAKQEQNKLRDEEEGTGLTDSYDYIDEDEVDALRTRLKTSAVTFKLQAVAPAARGALEKTARAKNVFKEGEENTAYWEAFNGTLVAKSIVSVTNARGQKDNKPWTAERVIKFSESIEPSEWQKVFARVYELNFVSDAIDQAVNADFS